MPPVKSRREQYSDATRAALLATAAEMFAAGGFARTSLDEIATATQVTRGAVYHHFENKAALFEAVLESLEMRTAQLVVEAATQAPDPWQAAMAGLDAFLDQCCEPIYGKLCWHEGPVALGWSRWKECEEKYAYGMTEKFLRVLMDTGYVERGPLETPTRLVFGLLGAAGLAIADAADADKRRVRDDCAVLIRLLLGGMRVRAPGPTGG